MVNEINLSKCVISENDYPFIIAEIGNNHNGDMKIAKKLIDEAEKCGVNAVKFQTKDIETAFPQELLNKNYEGPNSFGKTYREHKQVLELSFDQLKELKVYSEKKNLIFFSTPFDIKSLENLDKLDMEIYKISSFHVTDLKLVEAIAAKKKPVIMSTGMSTISDIESAVKIFKKNNCEFELMHCVSDYPLSHYDANLVTINALKKKFNCRVGYSGHEPGLAVSFAAATLGISSLERHITLDRSMYGSDQSSSLEPRGMMELISSIKKILESFGEEKLGNITDTEKKMASKLRGHIKIKKS